MHWLFIGSCSRCSGSFKCTNQCRLARSRSCRHRESRFNSKFLFNSFNYTLLLLNIAKASSRQKQLKLYKGNWATLEIMKTLLKNRRTYRNRIGTINDYDKIKKEGSDDEKGDQERSEESEDEKGDQEGNDTDSWEEMYQAHKRRSGVDESDNKDGGEAKGDDGDDDGIDEEDNGKNGDDDKGADNGDEDANRDIGDSGDEGGSEDGDRDNGKESNGSRGVSGRKVDEGRNGMKRKCRDDEPVTRAKRTKQEVSGGHQVATQPRKIPLRKKGRK